MTTNNTNLSLGEKLMYVRKAKGLSLENVADAIHSSASHVRRIELSETKCDHATLAKIKEYMAIKNAPLLEHELRIYKERIWVWNELITTARMAEAEDMRQELAVILALPFERELYLLYIMTECRIYLTMSNLPPVEERLAEAEPFISEAGDVVRFLYYRCKGLMHAFGGDNNAALQYFLKCLNCDYNNIMPAFSVYYIIGRIYISLGKLYNSIKYLERAVTEYTGDREHHSFAAARVDLAICYIYVKDYDKAVELCNAAIIQAESIKNTDHLGPAKATLALCIFKMGKHDEALKLMDEALELFQKHTPDYKVHLINKTRFLVDMKNYSQAEELSKQILPLIEDNDILTMLYTTECHRMTLNNAESIEYLENTAIPSFMAIGDLASMYMALQICEALEAHYTKKRSKMKALTMTATIRDIYGKMFMG